jgi:hypothetical protein
MNKTEFGERSFHLAELVLSGESLARWFEPAALNVRVAAFMAADAPDDLIKELIGLWHNRHKIDDWGEITKVEVPV